MSELRSPTQADVRGRDEGAGAVMAGVEEVPGRLYLLLLDLESDVGSRDGGKPDADAGRRIATEPATAIYISVRRQSLERCPRLPVSCQGELAKDESDVDQSQVGLTHQPLQDIALKH